MSKSLSRIRTKAFRRQAGRCCYCDVPMWTANCRLFAKQCGLPRRIAKALRCTAEHLVARQDGGTNASTNIAAACWHCNQRRHQPGNPASTPEQYREFVIAKMLRQQWHHPAVFNSGLAGHTPLPVGPHPSTKTA